MDGAGRVLLGNVGLIDNVVIAPSSSYSKTREKIREYSHSIPSIGSEVNDIVKITTNFIDAVAAIDRMLL